jgi:hypothetical protein
MVNHLRYRFCGKRWKAIGTPVRFRSLSMEFPLREHEVTAIVMNDPCPFGEEMEWGLFFIH